MKRIALALVLSLAIALTVLPGAAWAHHRHHGVFAGCCVFIGQGHPLVHENFFFVNHGFVHPHRFFIHDGFIPLRDGSTVIVVDPVPQPVWVPGFWWWSGFQWVWVPGHWAR